MTPGRMAFGLLVLIGLELALLVSTPGCGPVRVKLTLEQLRDLETCVLQDDQVERQNCVERLITRAER